MSQFLFCVQESAYHTCSLAEEKNQSSRGFSSYYAERETTRHWWLSHHF